MEVSGGPRLAPGRGGLSLAPRSFGSARWLPARGVRKGLPGTLEPCVWSPFPADVLSASWPGLRCGMDVCLWSPPSWAPGLQCCLDGRAALVVQELTDQDGRHPEEQGLGSSLGGGPDHGRVRLGSRLQALPAGPRGRKPRKRREGDPWSRTRRRVSAGNPGRVEMFCVQWKGHELGAAFAFRGSLDNPFGGRRIFLHPLPNPRLLKTGRFSITSHLSRTEDCVWHILA